MNASPRRDPAGLSFRALLAARVAWRPGLRLVIAAATLVVVVVMALLVADIVANQLRQTATESSQRNVEAIVRGYVDPTIREQSLLIDAAPDPGMTAQLDRITVSGDIRRINIWSRDGRVVYSTEPALVGRRFSIGPAVAAAFAGESVTRYAPDASTVEATGPLPAERYLEIYVPIRGVVDGNPVGVYEVFQDAGPIEDRVAATRQAVFLVALGASSLLLLLLWLGYAGAAGLLGRQNRLLRQRAAAEQVLLADVRRSEERFRSLVRNASDCIVIARADGTVVYESPAAERVLGYASADRLGHAAFERVHPDDQVWVDRLFGEVATTPDAEVSAQIRVGHRDGSWRSLEAVSKNLLDDPAVRGIVVNYRDITERKSLEDQLRHQAFHDALTGLPNRALFMDRLEHARTRSRGNPPELAVIYIDVDDFKAINDSLGHDAGDQLLVEVGARLAGSLRDGDTAARMGGDEFAILLEDAPGTVGEDAAERVIAALRRPFALASQQVIVHASAGLALSTTVREMADELLRNADVAMYVSKLHGKDRLTVFSPHLHDATIERLRLGTDLNMAMEQGEFEIVYQPLADLGTGEIRGVEALLRWQHPRRGLIGPAEFIPLAEESGLIVPLGRWVLRQACLQAQAWSKMPSGAGLTMAVNISGRQIEEPSLVADVAGALRESGFAAGLLTLEITESVLMADVESTVATLRALKDLGVRLAIDDFGTGYSSLSHLHRFPIDILKIDRSFVATLDTGDAKAALVRSILSLGQSLELEIIAEGIERPAQLRELQRLGAHLGQGFLLAMPLDADAMTALAAKVPDLATDPSIDVGLVLSEVGAQQSPPTRIPVVTPREGNGPTRQPRVH